MAKIVFWSPEEGKSGCTHVAIAVSSLLGITHKTSSLLIDANSNAKKIASSYTMYDDLVNANSFNDTNLGMNAIMRLIKSNKLSPDIIQNYSKPVLKGRLDILYSAIANTQAEARENLISMPLIVKNADEVYDLVLVDLPKTMTDDSAIRVMEQADIIVCVVPQEIEKLNNFLKKIEFIDAIKDKTKIYVVGDYEPGSKYNLFNLKLKYKIPDPCLVLPHNYLFTDACNDGNVLDFLYKNLNAQAGDYNGNFMLKATEIVEEIVKILKIKE